MSDGVQSAASVRRRRECRLCRMPGVGPAYRLCGPLSLHTAQLTKRPPTTSGPLTTHCGQRPIEHPSNQPKHRLPPAPCVVSIQLHHVIYQPCRMHNRSATNNVFTFRESRGLARHQATKQTAVIELELNGEKASGHPKQEASPAFSKAPHTLYEGRQILVGQSIEIATHIRLTYGWAISMDCQANICRPSNSVWGAS